VAHERPDPCVGAFVRSNGWARDRAACTHRCAKAEQPCFPPASRPPQRLHLGLRKQRIAACMSTKGSADAIPDAASARCVSLCAIERECRPVLSNQRIFLVRANFGRTRAVAPSELGPSSYRNGLGEQSPRSRNPTSVRPLIGIKPADPCSPSPTGLRGQMRVRRRCPLRSDVRAHQISADARIRECLCEPSVSRLGRSSTSPVGPGGRPVRIALARIWPIRSRDRALFLPTAAAGTVCAPVPCIGVCRDTFGYHYKSQRRSASRARSAFGI